MVELSKENLAKLLIEQLQGYRIYTPTTSVLRGVSQDSQPARPLGLSGGGLPEALKNVIRLAYRDEAIGKITKDFFSLIPWAEKYNASHGSNLPLSPSAATSHWIIELQDRFMAIKRNRLSGYDASEGALYVLFLAALIAHPGTPSFCAIDNADHGLNPRLAKMLFDYLSCWILDSPRPKQILITTHNPLVLDGLRLQDDRIRLFIVDRTNKGKTTINRFAITPELENMAAQGWSLSRLWTMGHIGGMPDV